jgi:hypothetical protein
MYSESEPNSHLQDKHKRKKLKIGLLQIFCGEKMAHACVEDDVPFHTNVSPFVRKHRCQTLFFASETEYLSSIRE